MTANVQRAPFPAELADMVTLLGHRPNWETSLADIDRGQGCSGLTLQVIITEPDSYDPASTIRVRHLFGVPAAAYDRESWQRWLFGCLQQISLHEDMEHFTIDGRKPYAPHHGPGEDPYIIHSHGTDAQVRTSWRGDLDPDAPVTGAVSTAGAGL